MTLPASGTITVADIRTELGMAAGTSITFPSAATRDLCGVASGSIVIPTDFHGKSVITQTDSKTSAATSHAGVSFGAAGTSRWVVVLAWHHSTSNDPGQTPTCTIGGGSATRIAAQSTGDGSGNAVGVAMFVAQPSGTSGTVAVSWGGLSTTIVALRVVNYNCASAHSSDGSGSASGSASINIPNKGVLIGAVGREDEGTGITWTNLTEKADESAGGSRRSWGWDSLMSTQSGRSVSYSPHSGSQGANAFVVASFALA